MRLLIIAVGKLKERGLRELLDDYLTRIRKHIACDELELREVRVEQSIASAIPQGACVVAMEIDGTMMSSEAFSKFLVERGQAGKGIIAFLIGGAEGLPPSISQQAHVRMSMSRFTLAHRVARIVLAEQLYRAVSIWKGEPYHR